MANICRLCATLRKDDQLLKIKDTNDEICQKLRKCCQVDIRIDDALPKCVCHSCAQALQQSFDFYTKVHESQESLSAFYPEFTNKNDNSIHNADDQQTSIPEVKKQTEQLASYDNDTPESEIDPVNKNFVLPKNDEKIQLSVIEKDEIKQLHVISIFEDDDEETTLILEEALREEIEDEDLLVENNMKKPDHENMQYDQKISVSKLLPVTKIQENVQEAEEDSIEEKIVKCITTKTTDDKEISEETNTINHDQQETEPIQCSDVGASSETWSTYPWICHICDCTESCYWDLIMHCQFIHDLSLEQNQMKFKCVDCQKECLNYCKFINHVRFQHRNAFILCCDVCDARCIDLETLATHRRTKHGTGSAHPKVVLCVECGRAFPNQASLTMHKKIHNSTQRFECNQCSAQFKRISNLKAHSKVHSDVKDYSCNTCGKSFRQKINLEAHLNTHSDDKPFECIICKKSFKSSLNLIKHNATHSDIKLFKCDHCEKSFRTKEAKQSHERTHTGEMPYTCKYCLRPFRFRSTFLGHLNTHTGNRPYSCVTCDHHFTNWSNYNKHMKRRHADTKKEEENKSKETLRQYEDLADSPAKGAELVEDFSNEDNDVMDVETYSIVVEEST